MRVELLTIGDELLDGQIVDANSAWLGDRLNALGLAAAQRLTLRDELAPLIDAFREIAARADVCVTTGGLGPTVDDLTVAALAAAGGVELEPDERVWADIERLFAGRPVPPSNRRQALIPVGARALYSSVGTAPGLQMQFGRCTFFVLPGVPREMEWHFEREVLPYLAARAPAAPHSRTLHFALIGESSLAERVERAGLPTPSVSLAYRARGPEVDLRLRAPDAVALDDAVARARSAAPEHFVGEGERDLLTAVVERLTARGWTLGVAESCTGGMLAARLTRIPGVSTVFNGGIVAYANSAKTGLLGVPPDLIATEGAVSEPCAVAMAIGACAALGVDLGVSITGIAGPDGGTPAKPVGTVCIGWASPMGNGARTLMLPGDRNRVREYATTVALHRIWRLTDPARDRADGSAR